tara:strand:- start:1183 stop:1767 length:585 start_codon:yes stop_codon:yes gene_type:complete
MSEDKKILKSGINRSGKYDIESYTYYYYDKKKENIFFCKGKDYSPFKKCITIDKYLNLIEKDFIEEMEDDLKKPRIRAISISDPDQVYPNESIYYDWIYQILIEHIESNYNIEISDSQSDTLVEFFKKFFKQRIGKYSHDLYYNGEKFNYDLQNIEFRHVGSHEEDQITSFSYWFIDDHRDVLRKEFLRILEKI